MGIASAAGAQAVGTAGHEGRSTLAVLCLQHACTSQPQLLLVKSQHCKPTSAQSRKSVQAGNPFVIDHITREVAWGNCTPPPSSQAHEEWMLESVPGL